MGIQSVIVVNSVHRNPEKYFRESQEWMNGARPSMLSIRKRSYPLGHTVRDLCLKQTNTWIWTSCWEQQIFQNSNLQKHDAVFGKLNYKVWCHMKNQMLVLSQHPWDQDLWTIIEIMGYSIKYPHPPMDDTEMGYLKISGFPRRTTAVFPGFQTLLIQNLGEVQNSASLWMISWNSGQDS